MEVNLDTVLEYFYKVNQNQVPPVDVEEFKTGLTIRLKNQLNWENDSVLMNYILESMRTYLHLNPESNWIDLKSFIMSIASNIIL